MTDSAFLAESLSAIAVIRTEIVRECASRRTAYPALVERMKMTSEQADLEIRLCAVWEVDCARYAAWLASDVRQIPIVPLVRSGGFTWYDRRSGLDRELDRRARLYPKWIAGGRLDPADAVRRTSRLSAMAELYDDGLDWHDTCGTRPPFGREMMADHHTPEHAEAIRQWRRHVTRVLTARSGETRAGSS